MDQEASTRRCRLVRLPLVHPLTGVASHMAAPPSQGRALPDEPLVKAKRIHSLTGLTILPEEIQS